MNYGALTIEELKRYAPIDPKAAAYVAEHAEELLDPDADLEAVDDAYERGKEEGYEEGYTATVQGLEDLTTRIEQKKESLDPGELRWLLEEILEKIE